MFDKCYKIGRISNEVELIWGLTIHGMTNHVFNLNLLFVLHRIKAMGFIILILICTGLMGGGWDYFFELPTLPSKN